MMKESSAQMGLILKYTLKVDYACMFDIDVSVLRRFQAPSSFFPRNLDLPILSNHSPSVSCLPSLISLLSRGAYHYVFSGVMLYNVDLPQPTGSDQEKA